MTRLDFNDCIAFLNNNYQKCPYDYPFDCASEPDKFGYFEAIMDKEGNVYEAPNGHQRGAVLMLARDLGVSAEEVEQRALATGGDYLEWIVAEAHVILMWHQFYIGTPNPKQQACIEDLKLRGHMSRDAFSREQYYRF